MRRVQLLGLQAVSTAPSARSAVYTAAVLQHAALLLLLLVSDSAVFVLPTEAVSPALLQLLHLLATVHHALIRQQQDSSGQADTSALAQLLAGRQQPVQLHIALQVITPTQCLAPTHMACIHKSTGVVLVWCRRQRCSSMAVLQTRTAGLL